MLNCTSWEQHCNLQRGFRDAAGVEQAAKAKLPKGLFPSIALLLRVHTALKAAGDSFV